MKTNRMMSLRVVAVVFLAAGILVGCDKSAENERMRQVNEARREKEEKELLFESLKTAVVDKQRLLGLRERALSKQADDIAKEERMLSQTVANALKGADADGKSARYDAGVLKLLKDDEINKLAMKLLGTDFVSVSAEFESRLAEQEVEDARYRKAMAEAEAAYSDSVKDANSWAKMTREQREDEIKRLKAEIKNLEGSRSEIQKEVHNLTKHSMVGGGRNFLERREKGIVMEEKIRELDREINRKRYQYDSLTHPDKVSQMESEAVRRSQNAQYMANRNQFNRIHEIERKLRPKRTVTDIASEYEEKTIGAMRKAMVAASSKCRKELDEVRAKVLELKNIEVGLPLLSLTELNQAKSKLLKL